MRTEQSELRTVTTEYGHSYQLSLMAVRELQRARNAADAEAIYNRFAPFVPGCDRLGIWLACDEVEPMSAADRDAMDRVRAANAVTDLGRRR